MKEYFNGKISAYKLEEVARSICSSRAEFDANQPVIIFAEGTPATFGSSRIDNSTYDLPLDIFVAFERG